MNILICGYGNVGKHVYQELKPLATELIEGCIYVYDKYKKVEFVTSGLHQEFERPFCNEYFDYAFICVNTEMKEDGSANTEEILDCIIQFPKVKTYIIKSAVPVGFVEKFADKDRIVISPEFWGTTQHSEDNPDFLILGGEREARDRVVNLYNKLKNGYYKYYFTDHKTAELVKYMENCWIATKVTFCNEFAEIAKGFDIDYNELRELWLADKRVSPSHTLVYPNKPYFDSHCLNKDVPALINFCEKQGIDTPLMKWVLNIRDAKKEQN